MMTSLKDQPNQMDIQKYYDYYMSQLGQGPYPPTPTYIPISGIGNHFGSLDRSYTVLPNSTTEKIPTIIQSPAEAAVDRAREQYKRSLPQPQKKKQRKSSPKRRRERDLFDSK